MITFNEQNRIFRLDTPATSYAMGIVEGGYLGHLYYGPRIGPTWSSLTAWMPRLCRRSGRGRRAAS